MKSVIVIPTVLLAILLACIPVYAVAGITGENTPSINVSVSPASPVIGDTVTISGTATGGNLTPGCTSLDLCRKLCKHNRYSCECEWSVRNEH